MLLPPRTWSRCRGLTLIELLAYCTVALVLVTLALPVFQTFRRTSASIECATKLKNLYLFTVAFTQDHKGFLPPPIGMPDNKDTRLIHPSFSINQYWWDTAYLGRYVHDQHRRRRDSLGKLTAAEMHPYQCPARLTEGPDDQFSITHSQVTYVMNYPKTYHLPSMERKANTVFLAEGRGSAVWTSIAQTKTAENSGRLRRFHSKSLNLLFFDGHIERFSGPDSELPPYFSGTE